MHDLFTPQLTLFRLLELEVRARMTNDSRIKCGGIRG